MKKLNDYLLSITVGLLILILLEGLLTLGTAFQFERYDLFGWIVQILLVICVTSISIKITDEN